MEKEWEVKHTSNMPAGKTLQDFLYFEGMYNPILRFAFTNVTDSDFTSYWNSRPYTIKPHQTVKLKHHLAVKFTKELVDKLMTRDNKGLGMAVPAERRPYEDKILAILPVEEDEELEAIKAEFIEQVKTDASRKEGIAYEAPEAPQLDFEDLRTKNFDEPKRRGRPRKEE